MFASPAVQLPAIAPLALSAFCDPKNSYLSPRNKDAATTTAVRSLFQVFNKSQQQDSTTEDEQSTDVAPATSESCKHLDFEYDERYLDPGHCCICEYEGSEDWKHHFIYHCTSKGREFMICNRCHIKNEEGNSELVKGYT